MNRYLVTGGAGFIGSHIARRLLAKGDEVVILDDFSTGREENIRDLEGQVSVVRGDVRDEATVESCAERCDAVFHLAAFISVPASIEKPRLCEEINVSGTLNVLEAARKKGVARVVFSSSAAVYGDRPGLPKKESDEPDPLSPYAVSKLTGEYYMRMYARLHGLGTVALRYFNVFGPRQDPKSQYAPVIPCFASSIIRGRAPVIFGDGTQTRDFVYVDDVVQANLLAAATPGLKGDSMNIGLGQETSILDLALTLARVLGASLKPRHDAPRPGDIHRSVADISNARKLLGFSPGTSIPDGLARTAEWFKTAG